MSTAQRVLIAQSNDTIRRKLHASLLEREIFSDCVSDGRAAIDQLERQPYALLLLDFSLISEQSADILSCVRERPDHSRPIVLAMLTEEPAQSLDLEGVQIILRRPFNALHIAEIVDSCLRAIDARSRRIGIDAEDEEGESADTPLP